MARIQFTSAIAELVGKLAGSVFQYSYGGYQVHTRVVPSNPQSPQQQLRRGWFGWFAEEWRTLTALQQGTFITAAGSIPEGFRLFIGSNINLYLIDEPELTSYVTVTDPVIFPVQINAYAAGSLTISAASTTHVVPAGTTLLIYSTYEKPLTRIFQNPAEYSPIVFFPAGNDLAAPVDITADFQALYGVLKGGLQLCIKSVLISTVSGKRGLESIVCSPPLPVVGNFIINSNSDRLANSNGDLLIWSI